MSDGKHRSHPTPCAFCAKIRAGEDEHGSVEYCTDPGIRRFAPINPVVPGHMLFVPIRHEWHPYNIGKAFEVADRWITSVDINRATDPDHFGYNLIISRGRSATQSVHHPHVHVIPRHEDDGVLLPWSNQNKETE